MEGLDSLLLLIIKVTAQITQLGRSLFLLCWFRCSSLRVLNLILPLIFVFIVSPRYVHAEENIVLKSDQETATAGYYQLGWSLNNKTDNTIFLLEQTSNEGTQNKIIYQGRDTASVISGQPDGIYTYIVKSKDGQYISKPVTVTVKHHPLTTAFQFFTLGAIVFIAILISILYGNRQSSGQ